MAVIIVVSLYMVKSKQLQSSQLKGGKFMEKFVGLRWFDWYKFYYYAPHVVQATDFFMSERCRVYGQIQFIKRRWPKVKTQKGINIYKPFCFKEQVVWWREERGQSQGYKVTRA